MLSKNLVNIFREKSANWTEKLGNSSNKFVKIHNEYMNNPEG